MNQRIFILTTVTSILFLSLLPAASAAVDLGRVGESVKGVGLDGCSVDIGDGASSASCPFDCKAGETVFVSAAAADGAVGATASCAGSSSCSAPPDCENSHGAGADSTGTCTISVVDGNGHEDKGSASCWTECDSEDCEEPEPVKCIGPYVGGKCLEDYIPAASVSLCKYLRKVECDGIVTTTGLVVAPLPDLPGPELSNLLLP